MENKSKDLIRQEALEALEDKLKAGLAISMGVGKTLISLTHMNKIKSIFPNLRVLVVASKIKTFDTWIEECDKYNLEHLKKNIKFCTYRSLSSKYSLEINNYDVIYLDECHNLLESHRPTLNNFKGFIIGLTGTEPRYKNSEKGKMINDFCPIVYRYLTDDAISDGILNDYEIKIHMINLDTRKNYQAGGFKKKWYTSEQKDYDYWCKKIDEAAPNSIEILRILRMKALMKYPSKERLIRLLLSQSKEPRIVFANTKEQADKLCIHSYHSGNPLSEENLIKFKNGEINEMSSVLQLREGINIPNLKEGYIMHAYGNERVTKQRIGRILRLNPKEKAIMHIACYRNTVDELWVQKALEGFDKAKISIINY